MKHNEPSWEPARTSGNHQVLIPEQQGKGNARLLYERKRRTSAGCSSVDRCDASGPLWLGSQCGLLHQSRLYGLTR